MNLPDLSIKRPVFMTMLLLVLVLFGLIAYRNLGIDLYPKVDFPVITAVTTLPSADPKTVETTLSEPIEEALATIDSIKKVSSVSAEGMSHVIIEFDLNKDIDIAYQEVQAKLNSLKGILPRDAIGPLINKFNINDAPILTLIAAADLPPGDLYDIVTKEIKDPLKRLPHVGQIHVLGAREPKVWLWIDRDRLKSYSLTLSDVEHALKAQHIDLPAGRIIQNDSELMVKTKGELPTASAFNELIIATAHGHPIRFRDIGRVEEGLEDERSYTALNGKSAIALMIGKQAGGNTVEVAHRIKKEVASLQAKFPALSLTIPKDDSIHIERSTEHVRFDLFFGGLLAIFIVFVFLRNIRSTLVCALALPAAVIGTFAFMSALGFTQNVMTLLALSLAIGLLIDDAIVVQENIIRHLEMGKSPRDAASAGTREITLAVLATTLAVVAVFVPVAFMKGIVGRFFYQFGMTVSVAVLLSMFVSFTVNPLFSAKFLKEPKRGRLYLFFESLFERLENSYARLLATCLKYKKSVLGLAVVIFALTLFLAKGLQFEFAPKVDRGAFAIAIKTKEDASLAYTLATMQEAEKRLSDQGWIESLYTTIGGGHSSGTNKGSIFVKMLPKEKRTTSQAQAMDHVRTLLSSLDDATVTISESERADGSHGALLQLHLRGPSLDTLKTLSDALVDKMNQASGYVDIDSSLSKSKPQTTLTINRAAAADMGVTPMQIATTLHTALGGTIITTLQQEGHRRDVTLRLDEPYRASPTQIPTLTIRTSRGTLVPIASLITLHSDAAPTQIERKNRLREVTVGANLLPDQKVLSDAVKELTSFVKELDLPTGYTYDFGGEAEMMKESFGHLVFALLLAVVLIYMVLAAQFESLSHPLIIMLALPLSIIGAIGSLLLFHMTMSIFTMIGIIMLMGLVTKNGILLVDFINTLYLKEKQQRDTAIITAGKHRLRPILMTTCAVVLGMLPIALSKGTGSETNGPMAVAVIGGLITSTLLTLIIVPVVYALFDSLRTRTFPFFKRKQRIYRET